MNAVVVEDDDSSSITYNAQDIEIKNNKFNDGTVTIDEKGIVTLDLVCTDSYCVSGTKDNLVVTSVGEEVLIIRMNTGLMDFSVTGADNLKWYFPDGTTSISAHPAITLTESGVVYAVCDDWSKNGIKISDNSTNENYVGKTSDLSTLTTLINANSTYITGDISFFSNLTSDIELVSTGVYGDIINFKNVDMVIELNHSVDVYGDISNLSPSLYLNLGYSKVYGILIPLPTLRYVHLHNTLLSISDVDQSVINLNNVTEIENGVLGLGGLTRTSASTDAINSLIAKGWTVYDTTVVD
jgi:hypothetical protein